MGKHISEGSHSDHGDEPELLYNKLKQQEAVSADPNEVISLPGLGRTLPEFLRLESTGLGLEELRAGKVERRRLMDAGFVFVNRIGNGEKPLISAEVPIKDAGVTDLGSRVLLTQEELNAVTEYQVEHSAQYGTGNQGIDTVRQDMVAFLEQSMTENTDLERKSREAFKATLKHILNSSDYSTEDKQALGKFLKGLENDPAADRTLYFMAGECLNGIDLAEVRGIPIAVYGTRRGALMNMPSPFLDSGYHFGDNPDVTLYPHNHTKTRRLNMAVVHLLSRGLNEMGASGSSHDQRYITSGEYVDEILGLKNAQTPEQLIKQREENLGLIALRILARVNKRQR